MLALLPCAATAYSPQARAVRAPHGQHAHQRARAVTLSEDVATTPATAFAAKKASLIAGLKREYRSMVKVPPWLVTMSSAPAPPAGTPGGSARLETPRARGQATASGARASGM
eukprot:scaffold122021_cov63-Phaeocystis_antarctica.AAC.2